MENKEEDEIVNRWKIVEAFGEQENGPAEEAVGPSSKRRRIRGSSSVEEFTDRDMGMSEKARNTLVTGRRLRKGTVATQSSA
ncbi:hypothetical protein MMC25_001369 [Agyrium rufum]|nr:hypothetical protein [Agyrium rufum]